MFRPFLISVRPFVVIFDLHYLISFVILVYDIYLLLCIQY